MTENVQGGATGDATAEMDAAFEAYRLKKFGAYNAYPIDAYTYYCAGYRAAIARAENRS